MTSTKQSTHFDIPPINCFVRDSYIRGEEFVNSYTPTTVIGVSSYTGHFPTFISLVEGKYLFHYLPVQAFAHKVCEQLNMEDTSYFRCPSTHLSYSKLSYLKNIPVKVFTKSKSSTYNGKYILTLDWDNDNDLGHLIELDDGNFVIVPNYRVIFNDPEGSFREGFKKIKKEWK